MIPVLQRTWSFLRSNAANRIVARESDVANILRGEASAAQHPEVPAMPEETETFLRTLLTKNYAEAKEMVAANEDEVYQMLQRSDFGGNDAAKQEFLKLVEDLKKADPGYNQNELRAIFGTTDDFYDPSKGANLDFDKMREFTTFPQFVDDAEAAYKKAQAELPSLPKKVELPFDDYIEKEYERWRTFCLESTEVVDEARKQVEQLDNFAEVLPSLRVDELLAANPELAAKLDREIEQSNWFVDEDTVAYDDEAADAEENERFEALRRWGEQLDANGAQVLDSVFASSSSNDNANVKPTTFSFVEVLNTTGGMWPDKDVPVAAAQESKK